MDRDGSDNNGWTSRKRGLFMTTLLWAIFYLWLALTILLAAMWLLREQDRRRRDHDRDRLEEELLGVSVRSDTSAQPAPSPVEAEPLADAQTPELVETAKPVESVESVESVDETEEAEPEEPEPLPWAKGPAKGNRNKRKKREQPRKQKKSRSQAAAQPEKPPVTETAEPAILAMLDGITLPYDLSPLTSGIVDPDTHAIFVSTHPDPAEVGTAFADELATQGYEIEPAGFDQALAVRGDDQLSMRISPEAGTVTDGAKPRYAGVGDNDVAIEVWVGNGSPPPLNN